MASYHETDDYDDEDDTVPCPNCGSDIYEDAEQCPICNEYITHGSQLSPHWKMTSATLLILAALAATGYIVGLLFSR